jgi:hypothetical protein
MRMFFGKTILGIKVFIVDGRMTRGFAFLAYPVEYAALRSDELYCKNPSKPDQRFSLRPDRYS